MVYNLMQATKEYPPPPLRRMEIQLQQPHPLLSALLPAVTSYLTCAARAGTVDAAERESKLLAWQTGLEERERAAEDLMERSNQLQEAELQVTRRCLDSVVW